jgi:hypothetical protein
MEGKANAPLHLFLSIRELPEALPEVAIQPACLFLKGFLPNSTLSREFKHCHCPSPLPFPLISPRGKKSDTLAIQLKRASVLYPFGYTIARDNSKKIPRCKAG